VATDGQLVVLDSGLQAVFLVAFDTGNRTLVSGCRDVDVSTGECTGEPVGSGIPFSLPVDIAVERGGSFIVVDVDDDNIVVIRVDRQSGNREVVSAINDSITINLEPTNSQLVVDNDLAAFVHVDRNVDRRLLYVRAP
jgi:hypothetical protein